MEAGVKKLHIFLFQNASGIPASFAEIELYLNLLWGLKIGITVKINHLLSCWC